MAIMEVWYGSPDDSIEELVEYNSAVAAGARTNGPLEGDELCDGHQMHYIWRDGKWK